MKCKSKTLVSAQKQNIWKYYACEMYAKAELKVTTLDLRGNMTQALHTNSTLDY